MNTNAFHYDFLEPNSFDIRDTDVQFSMGSVKLFSLPPTSAMLMPLQVIAGALMLLFSAALMGSGEGVGVNVVPLLLVALSAVTFGLALDVGRVWWLVVAAVQLAILAFAGYLLAGSIASASVLVGLHVLLTATLLVDYGALNHAPIRVWLGAEVALLAVLMLL